MQDALRRIAPLFAAASLFGVFVHAAAYATVSPSSPHAARKLDERAAPQAKVLVWVGRDVDGDGTGDFVNPTGQPVRGHDHFGDGYFGASRDGGQRRHEGVDFTAKAGQAVAAPISGYVTKIGYAYSDSQDLKYVEITNPALRLAARVFYVDPDVREGQAVALGDPIGEVETLQRRYAGITDHVHLELARSGDRFDATRVIVARLKAIAPARG